MDRCTARTPALRSGLRLSCPLRGGRKPRRRCTRPCRSRQTPPVRPSRLPLRKGNVRFSVGGRNSARSVRRPRRRNVSVASQEVWFRFGSRNGARCCMPLQPSRRVCEPWHRRRKRRGLWNSIFLPVARVSLATSSRIRPPRLHSRRRSSCGGTALALGHSGRNPGERTSGPTIAAWLRWL